MSHASQEANSGSSQQTARPKYRLQSLERPDIAATLLLSHKEVFSDVEFEDEVRIKDGDLQLCESDGTCGLSGEDAKSYSDQLRQIARKNEESTCSFYRVADKVFCRKTLPASRASLALDEAIDQAHEGLNYISHQPGIVPLAVPSYNPLDLFRDPSLGSTFILHAPTGPSEGIKIKFKRTKHYQLRDIVPLAANEQSGDEEPKENADTLQLTASSWLAESKIVDTKLYPFDLSLLEQSGYNPKLNTRVVVGGYLTGEKEDWMDDTINLWRRLEPESNIIHMSWSEANHNSYRMAAKATNLAGQQLAILLHYLDAMYSVDYSRMHIVGHSLGAHIAGFVGHYKKGKIGRITGLDPAGPRFNDVKATERLSTDCAKFVDIIHTNGGNLLKGHLGMLKPVGHIDYYPNGGSAQIGCSSVSTCSHGRAHDFFNDALKEYLMRRDTGKGIVRRAFRFEATIDQLKEGLVDLGGALEHVISGQDPLGSREVEFHSIGIDPPKTDENLLYFFNTRGSDPLLDTRQYLLRFKTGTSLGGKLNVRINGLEVLKDVKLNPQPGVHTLPFGPDKSIANKSGAKLSLELQYLEKNLLGFYKPKRVQLDGIELIALEPEEGEKRITEFGGAETYNLIESGDWDHYSSTT